ncbi:tyrosine-type recombinase/integrase [Vibrio comitans]|uniref:Integrase n=1 Tax=Vibrio comitans NBRC 102076 TaxID=1219078 RepID=A0A4Y3ISQ5_9VIBR|nr:integrase arm-type DNA-binding domain-containing protein [Vibrio comitans]GEA61904.1 integrase [Vibrio comitans NBRC 102076]
MAINKLSTTKIARLISDSKFFGKVQRVNDGNKLYICAEANGNAHWEFRYRKPFNGKDTYMRIGSYPFVGIADARKEIQHYHQALHNGIDPWLVKSGVIESIEYAGNVTFSDYCKHYFSENPKRWAKNTIKDKTGIVENHLAKIIGSSPLKSLTLNVIWDALNTIESGNVRNKALVLICTILNYASVKGGLVDSIETDKLKEYFRKPKSKNYPAMKPEEVGELINGFVHSNTSILVFLLFLWQLHLLLRPGEAASSEHENINLAERKLVIANLKNDSEHCIPLTESAIRIFTFVTKYFPDEKYLFPGNSKAGCIGAGTVGHAIRNNLNLKGKMTAHGTRSIGSTKLHEDLVPSHVVEACLSHIDSNSVRAAYYRDNFYGPRVKVMEEWSDFIDLQLKTVVSNSNEDSHLIEVITAIIS